ncbi:MAG: hypothetical protein HW377_1825 [Actinobacteria bacterium]|nr:hypothetical protein [Actinomycetota bacterium]
MIGGYYRFYPGDYFRDTSGLKMLEHGAYNLLLHNYYAACGKLESEKPRLYEMCHARTPEDIAAVDYVLNKFFRVIDGTLTNNRADEELADRDRFFKEQSRKGKLGGRPKKNPRVSKLSTGTKKRTKKPGKSRGLIHNQPELKHNPSQTPKNTTQKKAHHDLDLDLDLKEKKKELDLNRLSVGDGDGANGGGDGLMATPPPAPTPRDPVLEAQERLIEERRARGIPESGRTEPLHLTK